MMLFGKVHISPHAILRYKERIMAHRNMFDEESEEITVKKILREIDLRNTLKIVGFGNKYKFVFTKSNTEFRFERSRDDKQWIMVTCVRHLRMMPNEEPLSIDDLDGNTLFGIRTAIKIREKQKIEWELNNFKNENELMGE